MSKAGKDALSGEGGIETREIPAVDWYSECGSGVRDVSVDGIAFLRLAVRVEATWDRQDWEDEDSDASGEGVWACHVSARVGDVELSASAVGIAGTPPEEKERLAAEALVGLIASVRKRLGVR